MDQCGPKTAIPLRTPLFRGDRRVRIALVGLAGAGATTLFNAVSSTSVHRIARSSTGHAFDECDVEVGLDQARVVDLSVGCPSDAIEEATRTTPDVIVQVIDATAIERHLELTLELLRLRRPLVVALNKMDEARAKGLHVASRVLGCRIGVAVVPTIASLGYGIPEVFAAAVNAIRDSAMPIPLADIPSVETKHTAAQLAEIAARPGGVRERHDWRYWLDELFLSPRFGLIGSAAVFAAVLFVVFDVSAWLDSVTSARLVGWIAVWNPQTTEAVIARAVADGLIGLVGIVVPYMIPLVLLLIVLEQVGIMSRIAFAVDRGFHRLGLHGGVALPFLLGLGCNVPALSAIRATTRGGERTLASLLVTFVPCSARSAIVLALAGKYLGVWGVFAIFAVALSVIGALGVLLKRHASDTPGHIHEIPAYALPRVRAVLTETWLRTKDILTIVTPLLVGGSVVLALLHHFGADEAINSVLAPITYWWLGLPAVLGVPLLFGVLRKELSLLMIFQALGTFEIDRYLGTAQLVTFLLFLTLYVPCVSTFAVMLKSVGTKRALYSVALSVGVALIVSGAARLVLQSVELFGG
jgi:ferrous iron transport protein B